MKPGLMAGVTTTGRQKFGKSCMFQKACDNSNYSTFRFVLATKVGYCYNYSDGFNIFFCKIYCEVFKV